MKQGGEREESRGGRGGGGDGEMDGGRRRDSCLVRDYRGKGGQGSKKFVSAGQSGAFLSSVIPEKLSYKI
jgi:hypothetical protein